MRLNLCCWLTARMTRLSTSAPLLSLLRRARLAPTDQAAVPVRDLTIGHHPMQRSARGQPYRHSSGVNYVHTIKPFIEGWWHQAVSSSENTNNGNASVPYSAGIRARHAATDTSR